MVELSLRHGKTLSSTRTVVPSSTQAAPTTGSIYVAQRDFQTRLGHHYNDQVLWHAIVAIIYTFTRLSCLVFLQHFFYHKEISSIPNHLSLGVSR
jgi:hypothetical protein